MAVRTIVLSCHGSNLARPVIIHDIFHGLIYAPSTPCCGFFSGSRRMETAPTSIEVLLRSTQSQSDEPSDLHGSLSPTSVYSTWQSQAVTHPIMNRARRCLTSVIGHKPLPECRIPYSNRITLNLSSLISPWSSSTTSHELLPQFSTCRWFDVV